MNYDRLERKGRERYLDRALLPSLGYIRHELLGQGRFSDVYCVEDAWDGGRYACKISSHVEMLEREARIIEGLRHPLFPEYAFFRVERGLGILVREYVEGDSLEELRKRRAFSVGETVRMGLLLATGLQYLHGQPEQLLFRDLKPANIIIGQDGGVRLIDLGCVCSMTAEVTSRAGSPGFAAPDQLQKGGRLTASCDVYGLGKTLEALLWEASREGFRWGRGSAERGDSMIAGWVRTLRERRLERKLRRVLEACTEEDAGRRVADMGGVIQKLEQLSAVIRDA